MTFTVLGVCPDSEQIGIGIATASIAVGGLCPFYTLAGDIVTSQAFARPEDGLIAARHIDAGRPLNALADVLAMEDPDLHYRQIAIASRRGELWVHTGPDCRPWAGHVISDDCVAMGNFLAGEHVVEAMRDAFEQTDAPLAEKLIQTLEAGRDAGGQADAAGRPCRERSAAIRVVGAGDVAGITDPAVAPIDLRVDLHEDAVDELRRLFDTCRLVPHYNALRAATPSETPPLGPWEESNCAAPKPPSVYR